MSKYFIGPVGPRDAKLAIVAEKPGRDELNNLQLTGNGIPLIGASGRLVDQHLRRIGTSREETLILNAVMHFDDLGNSPTQLAEEIKRDQPFLHRTLAQHPNLNCIVAMGAAALLSLSNFHIDGILNRRGSILRAFTGHKMVPTLHPAFYMRGEWRYKPVVEFDLKRAFEESCSPELNLPTRTFHIAPTFTEAMDWLSALARAPIVSFDIETFYPNWIACIAFSDAPDRAFCIPLLKGNRTPYWGRLEEAQIWKAIQHVLNRPHTKYITQNGLFDCWHLWRHGIETPFMGRGFDTMYAHRLIAPDLPHALHFLTSIYTREPYYKDESGNWRKDIRVPDEQFWVYNCKDAACTLEVALAQREDMIELHLYDYFKQHVQPQFDAAINMRKRGLRVDKERLQDVRQRVSSERIQAEADLVEAVGWKPNTKSYLDMGKLFGELGVSASYTPTGRPQATEERMIHYMHQAANHGNTKAVEVLGLCVDITKRRTLESNFLSMALDANGFYHPSLDIFKTITGRAASEGADEGGPQIQNIPGPMRVIFVGDDEFSEVTCADLKQADAMVVAYEAQDPILIEAFETNTDVHRVMASIFFRGWTKPCLPPPELLASIKVVCDRCASNGEKKCRHSERDRAKAAGHGFRYGMGARKFCMMQATQSVFYTESEAQRIRSLVINHHIQKWQDNVRERLRASNTLTNCIGRKYEFYGLLDDEMVRRALAWLGSSPVSHVTNKAMERLDKSLPPFGAYLMTQTHDSVTISNPIGKRKETVQCIEEAFVHEFESNGRRFRIPVEISHGPSWGEQK